MPAYILAEIEIEDPETYDRYRSRTPEIVRRHGGHFRIRGGDAELLEGNASASRLVLIEFPDRETARRFYRSPEYQEILPLRLRSARSRVLLLDGCPSDADAG